MHVRHATADDRAGVIVCARQFEHLETSDAHVGQLFDLALACDGMFVAIDDGLIGRRSPTTTGVIGFCCALILPHPFAGFPYCDVVALFVQPSHRQTRAGFRLLRLLLRWCSTQPLDMVKMSAPLDSQLGMILHRAGFTAVETVYLKGSRWQAHR